MLKQIFKEEINRRKFLMLCVLGALPSLLADCQTGSPSPVNATPSLPPPTPVTSVDWPTLAKKLQGTLVQPDSTQYPTALQLFDPRFDSTHPAGIAYCTSEADVQACLAFARQFNLPLTTRAGGHSYAGYS